MPRNGVRRQACERETIQGKAIGGAGPNQYLGRRGEAALERMAGATSRSCHAGKQQLLRIVEDSLKNAVYRLMIPEGAHQRTPFTDIFSLWCA
jgi:hypothetical protein